MSETSWERRKYRTTNWRAYNAALKARGDLSICLDRDMQWLAVPSGKRGLSQTFSDAAIQFCLTIKCLFGQPWPMPDYSTVCQRQNSEVVRVHYLASDKGLHLLAAFTAASFNEKTKTLRPLCD